MTAGGRSSAVLGGALPRERWPEPRAGWPAVAGVSLFATAASTAGSWIPSVWTDEGASISGASRTLPELWAMVHNIDAVHGLYYALLHLWFQVVPTTPFWLRFPSAVAVGVTTALVIRLAGRWLDPTWALTAGIVFAILPRTTWMGIEGRSSAFSTLLAAAATLALLHWVSSDRPGWLVAYAALCGLGIALHLYLVFLLAAHGVILLMLRHRWRRWLAFAVAAAAGCVAALPVVLESSTQTGQIGGDRFQPLTWLRQVAVNQWFLGETPGAGSPDLAWRVGSVGLAVVAWTVVAVGVWLAFRDGGGAGESARGLVGWCLPWLVLPPVLVGLWSLAGKNMYHPRYFAFGTPALAILLALGLASLTRRWLVVAASVLVVGLAVPVYVSQRGVNAKSGTDWSEVAALVAAGARSGDAVYFSPQPSTRPIRFAYPAAFALTTDLTLGQSPAEHGSLVGENLPLSTRLTGRTPSRIWAIWRSDYQGREADATTLEVAGYRQVSTWAGTLDEVVLFSRE